ncbi:error-prone DNA polymerase [Nocardia asteroides NBRC 15531]|uniref:Error-prone DNA polymerase n=1 Tax=Nocardia asteroides NBRC 15531 TaxID=1110697 RepID=U5EM75_NOCAS|nr:error-prone DNA polymerase [Nocardia asteroides]TLF65586.1 error-prone DNA polymerase [Nocardia asteroides NBRC 15531]UGT47648.1 error-prone DNA polymerase [Nocardia asteroides]GAD87496.1 error-prone DNA polymerase [Nocardia asteroides NBRC 15531]SFM51200.1 error-prone DNA polymerase, DnaE-like [Nocardia asteroides]
MGWSNGPPTWSELERVLSGKPSRRPAEEMHPGDGGDSPAWSRKRGAYEADSSASPIGPTVPFAELHAHSAYSFLDGASQPEELVEEAVRLGLEALALTDHNGFYGTVRFAEAAREWGMPTVFGAELSLGTDAEAAPGRGVAVRRRSVPRGGLRHDIAGIAADSDAVGHAGAPDSVPRTGSPDPDGPHLLVLARGQEGYRRLSREMAAAHMAAGEKGVLRYDLDTLTASAGGHWHILTGCRKGHLRSALEHDLREGATRLPKAEAALRDLIERFGADRVSVELTHHGIATDDERNGYLRALADRLGLPVVATTGAHFAGPAQRRRAMALAAIRARSSLDELAGWLAPTGGAHLRSGAEMSRLFADSPHAVSNAVELARECAFDLRLIAPKLPPFEVPRGHDENSWLRELAYRGAAERYGPRERNPRAYRQIEHELAVIEKMTFPGYFLVVHDIVRFCQDNDILCQGRGSAANSAVCYAIGITNVDPVGNKLLFERFLSPERDGPPDIDVDIESDRREEAIQHVYAKYGRDYAAQVANVITYRGKSSVRDAARALGFSPGQQDAWSKQVSRWSGVAAETGTDIPAPVLELAGELDGLPRHLGIHSGGMVICDRPIADVCPVEWARMAGRSVLQWDKDDCAAVGLVKFDLLGLGMLSALHYMIDLVREHKGETVRLHALDLAEPGVYEMLSRADSIGVFQVESRAQMATLPRLKPRNFYDLVVEVALIRPGPIQGGSVHPFIRRRNKLEPVTYDHPALESSLERTLGVPLFQEQLMQMAVDVAGFTPAEADQLRRAMGSKRSPEKMERLKDRLYQGMRDLHGITGEVADRIYEKLYAFANFGFPESHSQSFASIVFYSAWFKLHHPAAFCAGLLRAQPMGFYSPQSLVADARRHGVRVHGPDINASLAEATLENVGTEIRLGLAGVRHIGDDLADRIVAERAAAGAYTSMLDLTGRVELTVAQAESLATAGALDALVDTGPGSGHADAAGEAGRGSDVRRAAGARAGVPDVGRGSSVRRAALWAAGAAAGERPHLLPGTGPATLAPSLPGMSALELAAADVWASGISPGSYPTEFLRAHLDSLGVVPAADLLLVEDGTRILVAGAVTHRQRPATAAGVTFLNLEDETGMVNVVCSVGLWTRYRRLAQSATALLIRGRVQNAEGAASVLADHLEHLDLTIVARSRDFR